MDAGTIKVQGGWSRSFSKGTFTDNRYGLFGGTVNVCGCWRLSDIFTCFVSTLYWLPAQCL